MRMRGPRSPALSGVEVERANQVSVQLEDLFQIFESADRRNVEFITAWRAYAARLAALPHAERRAAILEAITAGASAHALASVVGDASQAFAVLKRRFRSRVRSSEAGGGKRASAASLLTLAIESGRPEFLACLLSDLSFEECAEALNRPDVDGRSALAHWAARADGSVDADLMLDLLLAGGADLWCARDVDFPHATALHAMLLRPALSEYALDAALRSLAARKDKTAFEKRAVLSDALRLDLTTWSDARARLPVRRRLLCAFAEALASEGASHERNREAERESLRAPLAVAIACRAPDIVGRLIEAGAEADLDDFDGSPLDLAIACGEAAIFDQIWAAHSDARKSERLQFAFLRAIDCSNRRAFEGLSARRPNLRAFDEQGYCCVHRAVLRCDDMSILDDLLSVQDLIDMPCDWEGFDTPLKLALQHGRLEAARLLLDKGAQVPGWDVDESLLRCAMRLGQEDILIKLLRRGAASDVWSQRDETPLHVASYEVEATWAIPHLLAHGLSSAKRDSQGMTPLFCAIAAANRDAMTALAKAGALFEVDDRGFLPIHRAALIGDFRIVNALLVMEGVDVNALDSRGRTALSYAREKGWRELVRRLVAAGAGD